MEKLSDILQVAKDILQDCGLKGLHTSTLAELAVKQNKNMGLSVEDFQKKIQAALAANLKLKSKKPTFAAVNHDKGQRKGKPKQGWFRLKTTRTQTQAKNKTIIEAEPISTQFLGKAGEYAVMSELLFKGFNTSVMTVDDGIDLVASKEGKFFKIQVKTASRQENGKYQFSINKSSFERYNTTDVYYILVLRLQCKNELFIIPQNYLEILLHSGKLSTGASNNISITITYDERNKKYILNNVESIQHFLSNFGGIR